MSTGGSAEMAGQRLMRRVAALVVLCALAGAGSVGLIATPTASASGPEITGGGSSYAAVAINQWVAQVSTKYGISVNYGVSSSVQGLNEFALNELDFGASEIGYSTGQAQETPTEPYQYLPDVAGATCLDYNLTGRLGNQIETLRLNTQVMADIFTGTITKWDSPVIQAINPGLPLPDAPIVVVFRTDASGENYLFGQYLQYLEPQIWDPFVKTLRLPSPSANWPFPSGNGGSYGKYSFSNWVGQSGSDGASNFVAGQSDSITYVETAYALIHHDPCAYVQNESGNWLQPSEKADAVGLERAQLLPDLEQKLDGVYKNPLPDAYPISAYSYLVTPKGPGSMNPAKGQVLGEFIRFLACEGQQSAGILGYAPLPPNLVDEDFAAINRIPGAAPAPTTATPSNCQNPYVDGQTPLPGEPAIQGQSPPGGGSTTTTQPSGGSTTNTTSPGGPSNSGGTTGTKSGRGHSHTGRSGGKASGSDAALADGAWPGRPIVPGLKTGASLQNGQQFGNALASSGISLLGVRLGVGSMLWSVLALVALLAVPPLIAVLRRRRLGSARRTP
ncbi:MAG: substrate-binding domain-containing protein [Acidimicrobiales bacterium]|jgi:phosphate transport system substrate-binding protein